MKLRKGKVIKEIEDRGLIADYISAGWTEEKDSKEKPIFNKQKEENNLKNEESRI